MPLNPLLPLSVQPPPHADPLDAMGKMLQLRALQSSADANDVRARATREQYDEQHGVEELIRGANGDVRKALPEIQKRYPLLGSKLASDIETHDQAMDKGAFEMSEAKRKRAKDEYADVVDNIRQFRALPPDLQTAQSYMGLFQSWKSKNISLAADDKAGNGPLPNPLAFDPARDLSRLDIVAAYGENEKARLDRIEAVEKGKQAPLETSTKTADNAAKWDEIAGRDGGSVNSPAALASFRQELAKAGAPAALLARIPTTYTAKTWGQFLDSTLTKQQRDTKTLEAQKAAAAEEHDIQQEQAANPFGGIMPGAQPRRRYFSGGPASAPAVPPTTGAPAAGAPAAGQPSADANPHGEAFLKNLPPAIAQQVKALAEGRQPFPSGMAMSRLQPLIQAVSQYDPTFDATNYNQRAKVRSAFTTGPEAKQINALNTAIGHMSALNDAVDALGNHDWQKYNEAVNWLGTEFGTKKGVALGHYTTIMKAVADETTRVWRGTGGTEADIQSKLADLDPNKARGIQHEAVATLGDLLESKLGGMQNQFDSGMGPVGDIKMLTPESTKALTKMRSTAGRPVPVGSVTFTSPSGKVFTAKDAAARDKFIADAKAKGLWN